MRSVWREVLRFAIPGVVALVVVGAGTLWVASSLSTEEAVRDARDDARLLARGVVQPAITDDLLTGDRASVAAFDRVVRERVLDADVVSVRLWSEEGTVLYADEPDLVGQRFELDGDDLAVLRDGGAEAEISDLDKPENAGQRSYGELLEVYLQVRAPSGEPLLFEVYQRQSTVDSRARDVLRWLGPLVIVPLGLLLAIELTLAWRMAHRLRQSTEDREHLLRQAIDASEAERRRIAADLHDGVVQDLVGVSYTLAALSDTASTDGTPEQARRLASAAAETRRSVRSLRSLLVEIYPPNLVDTGLEGALTDLAAAANRNGTTIDVVVDPSVDLPPEEQAVVYRVVREALQNVAKHAGAEQVTVRLLPRAAGAELTVVDDGCGFDPADVPEGHVGLRLLEDLAREHGDHLEVTSDEAGTTVRLQVRS